MIDVALGVGGGLLWLLFYATLVVARALWERVLLARFLGPGRPAWRLGRVWSQPLVPYTLGSGIARLAPMSGLAFVLLSGAAIPLIPALRGGQIAFPAHLLDPMEGSLLWVAAAQWLAATCFAFGARVPGAHQDSAHPRDAARAVLAFAPALLLILSSASLTADTLGSEQDAAWSIAALLRAQTAWGGFRWLGLFQPLALILWAVCSWEDRSDAHLCGTWAGQALALNRSLLTVTLFLGGWQGPWIGRLPWLGWVYVLAKVGILTVGRVWLRVSHAGAPAPGTTWTLCTTLAAINLLVTVGVFRA